ncbi:MAG: hypothetical protein IJM34_11420 [Lachnospiraceae bacterium]|nr:hypothetical protein [Lachnospiraceae bacterium]
MSILGTISTPVSDSDKFNYDVNRIIKSGKNVDILFLGTSRVHRSTVPSVIEEMTGAGTCLVAASASQKLDGTYMLVKDLYERVHPKVIVVGVQWNSVNRDFSQFMREESVLKSFDRMGTLSRSAYMLEHMGEKEWPQLFYLYRYRHSFSIENLIKNIKDRTELSLNGYEGDDDGDIYYHGMGFKYGKTSLKKGNIPVGVKGIPQVDKDDPDPYMMECLNGIVSFCKEKNIRLILYSPPETLMNLYYIENYQDAVDLYKEYAKANGIEYLDMELLRNREEILSDDKFSDAWHLSGEAAYKYSEVFGEILDKTLKGEDVGSYFYPDFESLKKDVKRIVAMQAAVTTDGYSIKISLSSLQNEDVTPLYRGEVSDDGGATFYSLFDWTAQTELEFDIKDNSDLIFRFHAWSGVEGEDEAWQLCGMGEKEDNNNEDCD